MRILVLAVATWVAGAASAAAMFLGPPPEPVIDAPIDRALANVAADETLSAAERARLQGRLNLLAYVRNTDTFPYSVESGRLAEYGTIPCASIQPTWRGQPTDKTPTQFAPDDQCVRPRYDLAPIHEIPDGGSPAQATLEARNRLAMAASHYAEAVKLAPDDLRSRLGYAYALDKRGQKASARGQLREIVKRGVPRLEQERPTWEDWAVLSEAKTHLSALAVGRADKRRVALLAARLQSSHPPIAITPMVVPLADKPFEALHNLSSPVAFDFTGTGDKRTQGWLTTEAAWLVWDPRGRGKIASGFDLIGSATWAAFWRDGFQVLRALDDDRNGWVDGAELAGLALWRDANSDGISQPGEVKPVAAHGVAALAITGAGEPDLLIAARGVRFTDGRARPLYDWTPRGPSKPTS